MIIFDSNMIIFINIINVIIFNQVQTEEAKWEKTSAEDKLATTLYNLKVIPKYQSIKSTTVAIHKQTLYNLKVIPKYQSVKSIKSTTVAATNKTKTL